MNNNKIFDSPKVDDFPKYMFDLRNLEIHRKNDFILYITFSRRKYSRFHHQNLAPLGALWNNERGYLSCAWGQARSRSAQVKTRFGSALYQYWFWCVQCQCSRRRLQGFPSKITRSTFALRCKFFFFEDWTKALETDLKRFYWQELKTINDRVIFRNDSTRESLELSSYNATNLEFSKIEILNQIFSSIPTFYVWWQITSQAVTVMSVMLN